MTKAAPRTLATRTAGLLAGCLGLGFSLFGATTAGAVGGDFKNTDFAAAAPYTYDHATGGGAYDDRTVGDYDDITEQLEGAEFSCGDVVTYLTSIDMESSTVDAVQSADFDFRFLANSTGQPGAAHSQILGVSINYGSVQAGDGPGGTDLGISDDGGSTATLLSQHLTGPLFQSGSELRGTVRVSDLEPAERVVLRIDTLLVCDPGSNPTGNLQGQLDAGRVVGTGDVINTGQQTIPFLKVGELQGAGEPLLEIVKTVTRADGTCGVDDVDQMNAIQGDTVKYCYSLINTGTADLYDVEVIDDNGTPGFAGDDFAVTFIGLANLDGQNDAPDLASGAVAHGEALVTLESGGTIVNIADASGNNGLNGGNYRQLTDADTATVEVEGLPNRPPTALDDAASTAEETAVTIDAAANDSDPDDNLDPASTNTDCGECSLPAHGSLSNNGDGTFTYLPDADFAGSDSFVYRICDTEGLCDTATVTITVAAQDDPPVARDDAASTSEEEPVVVNAAANDSDPDDNLDPASATVVSQPAHGTVVANGDGTFTYTPEEGYHGADSFEYRICDTTGLCDTATVSVTIAPVNDPPVAQNDAYSTAEDTPLTVAAPGILGNDVDVDGDPLSVNLLSEPAHGTLSQNADGSFTYTPDADWNGIDSYTYEACDPSGACAPATVTITVEGVNDAPTAQDDAYSTPEDTPLSVPAPGILGNDSDVDGDALSVNLLSEPANGTLSQNSDGSFTYTPDADWNGIDSYTYEACDASGACAPATVTITVTPVNDAPAAQDDAYTTAEDTELIVAAPGVLGNDSDTDGDDLSVNLLSGPENGTLIQNADGSLSYLPNADWNGVDSYTYEACDTSGACAPATVTLTVTPVNDPPQAIDDQATTDEDNPVVISVLDNDSAGPDNEDPNLTVTQVSDPPNGSVVINGDGTVTYIPDPNYYGDDVFTYTVCDSEGLCDSATVIVVIGALNDPPVAADDSVSTNEDEAVVIPATANDSDVDGNLVPAGATVLTQPLNGTVSANGDGSFTYTPNANYNGPDSFTYEVCDDGLPDGQVLCDSATVTLDVIPVNDPPEAADDAASTPEDEPVTIDVAANDSDVDGDLDPTSVVIVTGPDNGSVTVHGDGTLTYEPNADWNGEDTLTYRICDSEGVCDEATVVITVTPVNDRPVARNDAYAVDEDQVLTVSAPGVLANDSDVDGDSLSVHLISEPANGSLTQNADGSFIYTPDADYYGGDSYRYEACDPSGACATATVSITVNPVPDPPTARDDSASTDEDVAVTIPVLANDSDPEGNIDPSSVTVTSAPTAGTATVNPDGSILYTPDPNANGGDTFEYRVCDTDGLCDTATVTVNVLPVPDPPDAADDAASVDEDSSVVIPVVANDSDPDGDLDPSTVTVLIAPENGVVEVGADGSVTYTPDANYYGADRFEYQICDTTGLCDPAWVDVTVISVPDPPVAVDDAYATAQNTTLTVSAADGVLVNDYDIDSEILTVNGFDSIGAFGGSVSMSADGSFEYTPATDFAGFDTFTYTVCDPEGACDSATVTIEVTAKNGRSISVDFQAWNLTGDLLSGDFLVTNQSGGYEVQIQSYEMRLQYRTAGPGKKEWIDVALDGCTFNPAAPVLLQDSFDVMFGNCRLLAPIPSGATVRATAVVEIYGHKDRGKQKREFLSRLSQVVD